MFSIYLGQPPTPKGRKRADFKDGLRFREPLTGTMRHIPQFDPNNDWIDRPDPDLKATKGR